MNTFRSNGDRRRKMARIALLGSAALLATAIGSEASLAQTAPPAGTTGATDKPSAPADAAPARAAAPVAAAAAAEPGAGDIVVTASKFGSVLAKAPVAVVSLSPQALEQNRIISTKDLSAIVPGIETHSQGLFSQTYIRGIGTNAATAGVESPVATYVDGVYLQRQVGSSVDLVDIASVDVLKGPQGTLYGRNATGGAILIQTQDPTHDFGGYLSAEYGNLNSSRIQAAINIPVSDTLAIRLVGQARHNGNYLKDVDTGDGRGAGSAQTARIKIKWDPSPSFSAVYSFEYYNAHDTTFQDRELLPAPYCTACVLEPGPVALPAKGFYTSTTTAGVYSDNRLYANTLTLHYTTDDFNITSITGYRRQKTPFVTDLDFTEADFFDGGIFESGPTFTNDTYLRTTFNSHLNGLIGASYLRERDHQDFHFGGDILDIFGIPTGTGHNINDVTIDSFSIYGELTYEILPGLKLTGGGRFNRDVKDIDAFNNATGLALFGLDPATATSFSRRASFNSITPRAVLSYTTGNQNFYASYNRGEKSGAFPSPLSNPTSQSAKPEKLDNFEIGAKNSFFGGKIRTTFSAFYGQYKDIQVTIADQAHGAVILTNAATATIKGLEFTGDYRPVPHWNIGVGVTYLHNRFGSYKNAAVFAPSSQTYPGVTCPVPAALGLASCIADLSHTPLPSSPTWSGYVRTDYTFENVVDEWAARISANAELTTKYDFAAGAGGPLGVDKQKGYTKVNADLTFMSPDRKLEISAFVTNMFAAHYYGFISTGTSGTYAVPSLPRTFGVRVKTSF